MFKQWLKVNIWRKFVIPVALLYDKTHKTCTYSVCTFNCPLEKFQRKSNMKPTTRCFPKKQVLRFINKYCTFSKDKRTMHKICKKTQRATQVSVTWYTFKGTLDYRYTDIRYRNNNLLTMPSNSVAKKSPKKVSIVKVKNWKVSLVWP